MKLELRNVCCGYDIDNVVLRDVTFSVESGEICCLLGPNGVGKTTLFRSILKLMSLMDGEIRINGDNIALWGPPRLAKYMAYVSQTHVPPFPYLVKDVVLLGRVHSTGYFSQPKKQDYEIAENAMQEMGIHHLRSREYTDISGGERQLVMIARALAQQPEFLVLDEPTANLDYGNSVRVLKCICRLRDLGYGVIMTTHNPDQAFLCDAKVALLQRNEPVKFGSAVDIIVEKNLRNAYDVDVDIVEYVSPKGRRMRLCAPEM